MLIAAFAEIQSILSKYAKEKVVLDDAAIRRDTKRVKIIQRKLTSKQFSFEKYIFS